MQISKWHMAMTQHSNCSGNTGWRRHSGRILSSFTGIIATAHINSKQFGTFHIWEEPSQIALSEFLFLVSIEKDLKIQQRAKKCHKS